MLSVNHLMFHTGVTAAEVHRRVHHRQPARRHARLSAGHVAARGKGAVALSPGLQIAPKVAFAPLFILWFGFYAGPKFPVAILFLFFPILVYVLGSVRAVDPD